MFATEAARGIWQSAPSDAALKAMEPQEFFNLLGPDVSAEDKDEAWAEFAEVRAEVLG